MDNIYVTKAFMPPYEEFIEKIKPLWNTSRITNMGELHKELELELKKYLGVERLSLFTNGHMALELAIQALDLEGEVITTPYTFSSTTHAIVRNGLKPVFCDIKEDDYTIDETKIEKLINENTTAIIPVHVYGHVCNHESINKIAQKYNLKLIYDAAHAFGVRKDGESVVKYGNASVLSFHATKVFNSIEGGAVVFDNDEIGRKLYGLKNFGIRDEITVDMVGVNAKMDEFRAAMGLCNIKYVRAAIEARKKIYEQYVQRLEGVKGIKVWIPEGIEYNYSYFPVYIDEKVYGNGKRDELYDYLKKRGIFCRKYFYPIITEFECYQRKYDSCDTPIAKRISNGILTLPLYVDLQPNIVDKIVNLVFECLKG